MASPSTTRNILLVTPFFSPQIGGVATYLEDLRRGLGNRGHGVFVMRFGDSDSIHRCAQCNDDRVFEFFLREVVPPMAPLKGFIAMWVYLIPTLWRLTSFLYQNRISLVCLEYPLPVMFYFRILRWTMPIKLLVDVHGDDVASLHLLRKHEQALVRWTARGADLLLAHSNSMLEQARAVFGQLRSSLRLPCGVECSQLRAAANRTALPEELRQQRFVLTVANLYKHKGVDVLVRAVARIKEQFSGPLPLFAIVGTGPEQDALRALAEQLNVAENLRFLGKVDTSHVPVLFQQCEFFVLPSRAESFGIVLLEAMTFGKLAIASRVGGIPEVVEDKYSGLLFPSGDAEALAALILRAIEDEGLRLQLGGTARRIVEESFDYPALIERYEELFLKLCS